MGGKRCLSLLLNEGSVSLPWSFASTSKKNLCVPVCTDIYRSFIALFSVVTSLQCGPPTAVSLCVDGMPSLYILVWGDWGCFLGSLVVSCSSEGSGFLGRLAPVCGNPCAKGVGAVLWGVAVPGLRLLLLCAGEGHTQGQASVFPDILTQCQISSLRLD